MSVIATAVKHMLAAGVPHEQIVSAITEMEAQPRARSNGAERTARWRHKASQSVTCDESDGCDERVSPKEIPPTPPKEITPSQIPSEAKASSVTQTSRAKSRRCPEAYVPGLKVTDVADALGFTPGDIERELSMFKDHQFRDAHSDWDAAFRNWIRTSAKRNPRAANGPSPKFQARQDNLARSFAGAEAAERFLEQRRSGTGDA